MHHEEPLACTVGPQSDDFSPYEHSATHWPLLGTVIEVWVTGRDRAHAVRAEKIVCDEISRLERTFNIYDDTSMLRRWMADPGIETSAEFTQLLAAALDWQQRSDGAFNVATRRLSNRWAQAATHGSLPDRHEIDLLARTITTPPYRFDGQLRQVDDCNGVDLNGIAKGFIVDRALDAAWHRCDLESLIISAGGDIAHRGPNPIAIGIEDPAVLSDNAAPLLTIDVRNAAVATSGSARRGVSVAGTWVSHVLDPRTGHPADASGSVTVLAPDAATADVLATIMSVMKPAEGLRFIEMLHPADAPRHPADVNTNLRIECWIVDHQGGVLHIAAPDEP